MPTGSLSAILNMANLTSNVMGNSTGHIANFKQFFKISAFFIAFILFYAISVPLIMWLVNKNFKVIGGLVQGMRNKGYSSVTVRLISPFYSL